MIMTAKRSILIVDDEPLARQSLEVAIRDSAVWQVAGSCRNAEEARRFLDREQVDLVLIDIRMPGEGGISLASYISDLDNAPLVAFVTAYDEHAIEAFELFAIDYLLKPFSDQRLSLLLDRANAMAELRKLADRNLLREFVGDVRARNAGETLPYLEAFVVRSIGSVERIALAEVQWIGGAGNYVELHLAGRTVLHRTSMGAIVARLPAKQFIQVHRTAVVQRAQLRALRTDGGEKYRAELKCGATVPVSGRHLAAVRSELAMRGV